MPGQVGNIVAACDRYALWDLKCYDNVFRAMKFIEIPTVMNKVRESKIWYGKQPAHLLRADLYWGPTLFTSPFQRNKEAPWDGTQNMPLHRLADPKHKDSKMIYFN